MADIVGRIKKLIALSKNNNSTAEAANAAALAQELMFKHQIGEGDLDVGDTDERTPEEIVNTPIQTSDAKRAVWKSSLAHAVATGFGCEMYFSRTVNGTTFHIFGTTTAVQTVHYVFGYLNLEITRLCEQEWRENGEGSAKTWKNSFRLAAVNELRARLLAKRKEQQIKVATAPTSTAIALYKTDEERVASGWKAESKKLNLRSAPTSRVRTSYSAYDRGRTAGRSIGLDAKAGISASKERIAG